MGEKYGEKNKIQMPYSCAHRFSNRFIDLRVFLLCLLLLSFLLLHGKEMYERVKATRVR